MIVRVDRAHTRLGKSVHVALRAEPGIEVTTDAAATVDVVLDAGILPVGRAALERELEAGHHFVDACWQRAWSVEVQSLDTLAREKDRAAICAAGAFSGLTDPFARGSAEQMVRVNEVLLGLAVGDASEFDDESMQLLLESSDKTIPMVIGGEQTVRCFFGDRRAFGFPPPIGDQYGGNIDVPELATFQARGVKAASVRLTVAPQSGSAIWGARALLSLAHRGMLRNPSANPRRWKNWLRRLSGSHPWALAVIVRGIAPNRLPLELRSAFLPPAGRPEVLSVAPLVETVLSLASKPAPGAGPCSGRVSRERLMTRLSAMGVTIFAGDLGGWRASKPPTA